jgi:transcriptional regulator with XRE-family HTH domain
VSVTEDHEAEAGLLEDDPRVADWIRTYRMRRNLTLVQLSELSGISVGHLSRLENGTRQPTVRLLLQLARALGVSLGTLVGETAGQNDVFLSRADERSTITTIASKLQSLSDPELHGLQAVEVELLPGRVGEPAAHPGEEWIYVLSGECEIDVSGAVSALGAGDAIHFQSDVPHSLRNPHDEVATVLVVNALPALHLNY